MNSQIATLRDLKPTQIALGMAHVRLKMMETRSVNECARGAFFSQRAIAVVRAPANRLHVVDHHHWARAWIELGMAEAPINLVADFAMLDESAFLANMNRRGWLHPYDERGTRVGLDIIPESVADMPDDPYQSLAAFLRLAGVFENPGEFNAKFAWADFLRKRVSGDPHSVEGFANMLAMAFRLSNTREARALPGYLGTSHESVNR
jgi:hypothetical protein